MSAKILKKRNKLKKLKAVLTDAHNLLIIIQDNPDPDAISAATALKDLVKKTNNINTQIAYGGTIGRAENRELVHYLQFKFYTFGQVDCSNFDLIAMVDTQPRSGNNPLPADIHPDIVIDHHPIKKHTRKIDFTDIRQSYGSTSTILWEYLAAAKIRPDISLATALVYGILSDTQDLGREATKADIEAMETLYPLANKRMLSQIKYGREPNSYYQLLAKALNSTKIYDHSAICTMGTIDNPDMIGEVADLLLRHELVDWVLCYGTVNGTMQLSLRTQDKNLSAGDVMHSIIKKIGTGGGHDSMAGGQVRLKPKDKKQPDKKELDKIFRDRFLKALGINKKRGTPLVAKK